MICAAPLLAPLVWSSSPMKRVKVLLSCWKARPMVSGSS